MSNEEQQKQPDTIVDILAGSCAVGFLDCSIAEFARGIKYFIDQESRSIRCDTHLLNVLRRSACAAWELGNASGPSLAYKLAEARRDERATILKAITALPFSTQPGEANHNDGVDVMSRKEVLTVLTEKG